MIFIWKYGSDGMYTLATCGVYSTFEFLKLVHLKKNKIHSLYVCVHYYDVCVHFYIEWVHRLNL